MKKILTLLLLCLLFACQAKKKEKPAITSSPEVPISDSGISLIDTLINSAGYLVLGPASAKAKIIREEEIQDFPSYEIMIGYRNDVVIAEDVEYVELEIYRKYHPTTSFEDYPAEIYEGELADPDFTTDPDAKRFITRITDGCMEGINFAGHYTLITWGCGSPCQSGVLVDRITGTIHGGYGTSMGAAFRKDSRMIIRNVGAIDSSTNLIYISAFGAVNHELWTGKEFVEVE